MMYRSFEKVFYAIKEQNCSANDLRTYLSKKKPDGTNVLSESTLRHYTNKIRNNIDTPQELIDVCNEFTTSSKDKKKKSPNEITTKEQLIERITNMQDNVKLQFLYKVKRNITRKLKLQENTNNDLLKFIDEQKKMYSRYTKVKNL